MNQHPSVYRLHSQSGEWGSFAERKEPGAPSLMGLAMSQWWRPFDGDFAPPFFDLEPNEIGRPRPELDVCCAHAPFVIFSEKALRALQDILKVSGQLMAIQTSEADRLFVGFYPGRVVDCYDRDNAFYDSFATGDLIYDPALKGEALPEEAVFFTIPEDPAFIFFTDQVRRRIEEAGLNGFSFERAVPVS